MLEEIWNQFFNCLSNYDEIVYSNKLICGVNFLYMRSENNFMNQESIKNLILSCSKEYTNQYHLIYRIEFVRQEEGNFIFRHRFFVPNKKMFCCGNECADCTRFRK